MLYYVKAEVSVQIFGISGPFVDTISKLVDANSTNEAKGKFEKHVSQMRAHMEPSSKQFKYLEIADTI